MLQRARLASQPPTSEGEHYAWLSKLGACHRRAHPTYYETVDWFRHLGVSDEVIERVKR
jgi:hypothetical protein